MSAALNLVSTMNEPKILPGLASRKSKFAYRQKLFVRNFLSEQMTTVNQYYLFPGNKNPLNRSMDTNTFFDRPNEDQSFLQRSDRKCKRNQTVYELRTRDNNKSKTSMYSKNSHKSKKHNDDQNDGPKLSKLKLPLLGSTDDLLKELSFIQKKTDHAERDVILNNELKKLQALANKEDASRSLRKLRKRTLSERLAIRNRFIRAVKKVIIVINMLEIHKIQMQRMLLKQSETFIHQTYQEEESLNNSLELFDKNYYSRPKEPKFPEEAKRILQLSPDERTEEMIRFVTLSLNFCVPEFLTFPVHMQRGIAKLSFYQEFEPSRVIIRQGHLATNYYIILSGVAIVSLAWTKSAHRNQLAANLKRGDCYGEHDIIKDQLRSHTITVYGKIPCGLLVIEKEDFFKIQTPVLSIDERYKFLSKKVNFFKIIHYPVHKLRDLPRTSCFSIYYRNGHTISENSVKDEWLYVIKSGSCRVLKKVRFDSSALNFYQVENKSWRRERVEKQVDLDNADHSHKLPVEYEKSGSMFIPKRNVQAKSNDSINYPKDNQFTYLEIKKLDEGDIFGIHDLVFTDPKEVNSLILVSDGAECILIKRTTFMDICDGEALLRMRFNLPPYPNDESFILKYFSYLKWGKFKDKLGNKSH